MLPKQYEIFGDIMNAARIMSKSMNCRVRVRSWKFSVGTDTRKTRNIWIYGFGGRASK